MERYLSNKIRNLSFISIIMVVFIHAYNLQDRFLGAVMDITDPMNFTSFFELFISNGLARVAVPMFFIISGYLFFHNLKPSVSGFLAKYKSRSKTVLLPFLTWSAMAILFALLLQNVLYLGSYMTGSMFIEPGIGNFIKRLIFDPVAFQLWFMRDLFYLIILSPLIYLLVKYLSFIPSILVCLYWLKGGWFPYIGIDAVLFFTTGAFFAVKKINLGKKTNKSIGIIIAAVWIILLFAKTYLIFGENVQLKSSSHQISIILGCIAVWHLYDIIFAKDGSDEVLKKVSASTFIIFVGHEPIMNMIMDNILKIPNTVTYSFLFLTYIVVPIFMILVLIGFNRLMAKLAPRALKALTGARGNNIGM